jgi:NADH-quinone oxidoreductase subunit N
VYEGAPTPVTAFMSTGVKAAAFAGFAKLFVMAAGAQWQLWVHTMTILAIVTMVVGNVLALPQRNIKRMLAYSSIAHAGYLTMGLIAAGTAGTWGGVTAILFYLVTYALMNLGAFGVLIWIRNRRAFDYSLDGIAGLGRSMPWPAAFMGVLMISLTGIPPTAGFWGKFYLFTAVIQADLTWLAIIAVVMSAVSAYYYLRVVWFMYFREASETAAAGAVPVAGGAPAGVAVPGAVFTAAGGDAASYPGTAGAPVERPAEALPAPGQAGVVWAVSLCAFGVIAVGLFPGPLLRFAEGALRVVLGG